MSGLTSDSDNASSADKGKRRERPPALEIAKQESKDNRESRDRINDTNDNSPDDDDFLHEDEEGARTARYENGKVRFLSLLQDALLTDP